MGAGEVEPKLDEALGADPVRSRLLQQERRPNLPSFLKRISDGGVLLGLSQRVDFPKSAVLDNDNREPARLPLSFNPRLHQLK